jgi:hypothetical protein
MACLSPVETRSDLELRLLKPLNRGWDLLTSPACTHPYRWWSEFG